jgi:hypothetical protein
LGPPSDGAFTASEATVGLRPSTAHGIAANTDTLAANATLARSPRLSIRNDASSFTSDAKTIMDTTYSGKAGAQLQGVLINNTRAVRKIVYSLAREHVKKTNN